MVDCAICLSAAAEADAAALDCCAHRFCFACIAAWTEQTSRCPLCKRQVAWLRRPGGEPVAVEPREQRADWLGDDAHFFDDFEAEEETPCQVCGRDDDAPTLLLCDACDSGACHLACAGLAAVPDGDWLCARCAQAPAEAAEQETAQESAELAPEREEHAPHGALFERFRLTQPGTR